MKTISIVINKPTFRAMPSITASMSAGDSTARFTYILARYIVFGFTGRDLIIHRFLPSREIEDDDVQHIITQKEIMVGPIPAIILPGSSAPKIV
jgi:hypothetical protein